MSEILVALNSFWAVIVGAVTFVLWLARLESGMIANRKKIQEVEKDIKENQRESRESREAMDKELKEMRKEMSDGFKEIIYRLPKDN